jgi:hypothetical protein
MEWKRKPSLFTATRGWLHRFRNRFNLKNIQIIEEAASTDGEAAVTFPAELNKIIKEGNYDPRQVFNGDETGLFLKRMPNRTYIHKSANQAPGFKAWKDRPRERKYTVIVQCSVQYTLLLLYLISAMSYCA